MPLIDWENIAQAEPVASDDIEIILGNSGDGKTFSLLKNMLYSRLNFCYISLEETTFDMKKKIEYIRDTYKIDINNNYNIVGGDNPIFDDYSFLEWLSKQQFHQDIIIIDSWTYLYGAYGVNKCRAILNQIKKTFVGKKVYIIAHTKKPITYKIDSGFERFIFGGQYLFQQATAVFQLVMHNNHRCLKVLKANRSNFNMHRGDIWLI